ncbi:Protein YceI [bacterium HR33]|nr:Protein YceI [bacterium HR33]
MAISVRADSLALISEADSADAARIMEAMLKEVLLAERFPEIAFVSREVRRDKEGFEVIGDFTLVGVTRPISVRAKLQATPSALSATTHFSLRQSDFGIKPYGTALGTVKVSDRIDFEIELIGAARSAQ